MTTTDKDFVVKNGLVVQGNQGTINGSVIVTEAALNTSLGDYININEKDVADGVAALDANANVLTKTAIVFEGSTADVYETTLDVVDPTADRTITLPNTSGTVITTGNQNDAYPSQSGNTGKYLKTDGTNVSWATVAGGGGGETLTIGTGLSGTSYNGSAPVTIAIDSTVVTTSGTQTLTNKTLTSPTITGTGTIAGTFTGNLTGDVTGNVSGNAGTVTNGIYTTDTGTVTSTMIADGTIVNTDINATAAIAATKISGTAVTQADTGTVTNTMLAGSIANNKLTNSSITVNGSAISLGGSATVTAVNPNSLTIGTGLSGTSYDGSSAVTVAIDSTVATLTGSQTLTNKTLSTNTSLSANLNANSNKITSLGTPTASTDAATKQYVDDVAQGLHIHASCVTATTSNIDLSTDLQAGDVIDGVTLVAGDRVLVKNQSTTSQNGIYLAVTSGAAVRASDFDSSAEIQGGDFVFVTGGTVNDNTGWVQVEKVTTVGTDPIVFTQFSGAGTYLAGNGLTLTSNTFSINTAITADLSTSQVLTNKTINGANNTLTVRLANDISGFGTGIAAALAINTGSAGAPVLFNGALGTPSSATLSNATGLPVSTGISGLGTGVATFLATPSSANLISAVTDETGSGALVFGTTPTLSTPVINNPRWGYTTTATAAGTTTLTNTSNYIQIFTGTSNQTVVMPVTSTLAAGQSWEIENNSTGTLTVNSSGGNLIVSIIPGTSYALTCIGTTLTTAADWNAEWNGASSITGTGANVFATSPTLTTPNIGVATGTSFNSITGLSSTTPAALGTAAVGTGTTVARADHVHPTATVVSNTVTGTNSADLVLGAMADNDNFRIRIGGTASNAGFVEIATADDGNEPIHVRQYSGAFATLTRTATLLDGSGNTTFPGSLSAVSKSFDIEHPTKENMRLRYGSLEGPENGVYIRGKSIDKIIQLPDYWIGLVDKDTITVQLTSIGSGTIFVKSVSIDTVEIGGTSKEFYYFIQAERKDIDKLIVEY